MVHKKRPQWSLYFALELYVLVLHIFNVITLSNILQSTSQTVCIRNSPIVPFSTELRGACWIGGLFSPLVSHFESLAPTLKGCC